MGCKIWSHPSISMTPGSVVGQFKCSRPTRRGQRDAAAMNKAEMALLSAPNHKVPIRERRPRFYI